MQKEAKAAEVAGVKEVGGVEGKLEEQSKTINVQSSLDPNIKKELPTNQYTSVDEDEIYDSIELINIDENKDNVVENEVKGDKTEDKTSGDLDSSTGDRDVITLTEDEQRFSGIV